MKLYQTWREGMSAADTAIITAGWVVLPMKVFSPQDKTKAWRLLVGINLGLFAIRLTIGGQVINWQLLQQLLRRPRHAQENSNTGTDAGTRDDDTDAGGASPSK